MTGLLHEHCALVAAGDGAYERICDRTWWGHNALFGGYAQALALQAMTLALDQPDKAPQAMTIHFLRPFVDGPFRAETHVERTGRAMANVSARLYSGGKLAGLSIASFGTRRPFNEFRAVDPPSSRAVGDDEAPTIPSVAADAQSQFDMFTRIGSLARGGGEARVGGWVRQHSHDPIDFLMMPVLADLWIPAAYHRWTDATPAVSADITTHFRASLPREDVPPSEPLFVELVTAGSLGGFVDEDAWIWSAAGVLLAQSRQMRFVHGSA